MKRFYFRLQKVKEVKENVEKQCMLDLAEAKKIVFREHEKMNDLRQKNRQYHASLEDKKKKEKLKSHEMNLYYKYLGKLNNDIKDQKNRIQSVEKEMEKKRQILLKASQNRKILDKLKERKQESYKIELSKKEQFVLDDLSANKFARRRHEI